MVCNGVGRISGAGRLIRNEETFKKMEDYLNRDFLDMIEERYYK